MLGDSCNHTLICNINAHNYRQEQIPVSILNINEQRTSLAIRIDMLEWGLSEILKISL